MGKTVDKTPSVIAMFFVSGVIIFTALCNCVPVILSFLGKDNTLSTIVNIFPWLPELLSYRALLFVGSLVMLVFGWYHIMSLTEQQHQMGLKSDLRYVNYLKSQNHFLWFLTFLYIISLFMSYGFIPAMTWINNM